MTNLLRANRFEEFITQNLDSAYRFAFTYMKNKEDAEDVVYDSVLKAMKSLHSLRRDEGMKSWFFKIVSNTALSALKSSKRTVVTDFSEGSGYSSDTYEEDFSDIELSDILDRLSEHDRGIVILKICEEMTFGEIAAVLSMSENTVKTKFYRAVRRLKNFVAE